MRVYGLILLLTCAAAVTAPAMAQDSDILKYCKSDIERLCSGIAPGGGKLMSCLKAHSKEMSVGCAQALQKMKAN